MENGKVIPINPMEAMIQQAVADAVRTVVREELAKAFEPIYTMLLGTSVE